MHVYSVFAKYRYTKTKSMKRRTNSIICWKIRRFHKFPSLHLNEWFCVVYNVYHWARRQYIFTFIQSNECERMTHMPWSYFEMRNTKQNFNKMKRAFFLHQQSFNLEWYLGWWLSNSSEYVVTHTTPFRCMVVCVRWFICLFVRSMR